MQLNTNLPKCNYTDIKILPDLLGSKSHVGDHPFKVGIRKSEVGSQKSEVRSRKSEVESRKSEVGSRKSLLGFRRSGLRDLITIGIWEVPAPHGGAFVAFCTLLKLIRGIGVYFDRCIMFRKLCQR